MSIKVLFYGNCQLEAIYQTAREHLPPNSEARYLACCKIDLSAHEFAVFLKDYSHIVLQRITESYRGTPWYSTSFVLQNCDPDAIITLLPSLHFDFYNFDVRYVNVGDRSIKKPEHYHHIELVKKYLSGASLDEYIDTVVNNYDFKSKEELVGMYEDSITRLRERESTLLEYVYLDPSKLTRILVSDYIEQNYKKHLLFNTINHPTHHIINFVTSKVLDAFDFPHATVCGPDRLSIPRCMIYKCINKVVDFDVTLVTPCVSNKHDIKSISKEYYNHYNRGQNKQLLSEWRSSLHCDA